MTETSEQNHDEPAAGKEANQQWLGPNVATNNSPERGVQDRFEAADLKSILNPMTHRTPSGRMPLFRR